MEGLIPFVIGAIRRSQERGGYRCVSPDGSGSSHGGSRRHLIDYWELPGAAEDDGPAVRARPGSVQATAGAGRRRAEDEHGRPAAVVAGSAHHRR
ncbi:hypothetical protein ABZP36_000076 [Zizania latifolia]